MISVSSQEALRRWDELPENLKETMFSEFYADMLWRICENQHLTESKIQTVADLTGYVILGFILPEDLAQEIKEHLNINGEIADSIVGQIDKKIFGPIKNDIKENYSPPKEKVLFSDIIKKPQGTLVAAEKPPVETPVAATPTTVESPPQSTEPLTTKPFVLYEEKPLIEETRKPFLKPFSLPFKILGQKPEAQTTAPVQVKIETSETPALSAEVKPKISKIEKPRRTVNYSEFRTPLSPFGQEEGVINLETFETFKKPEPTAEPAKTENENIINLKIDN